MKKQFEEKKRRFGYLASEKRKGILRRIYGKENKIRFEPGRPRLAETLIQKQSFSGGMQFYPFQKEFGMPALCGASKKSCLQEEKPTYWTVTGASKKKCPLIENKTYWTVIGAGSNFFFPRISLTSK